jgi:phosphonatase-like hydrolase
LYEVELVILDMAGTTVEDCGQVPASLAAALAEYGIKATREQLAAVRGSSKRQAVLRFIPEGPEQLKRAEAVYSSFREHLIHRYASEGVRPVNGADGILRTLRERGVSVALNTGFDRETTDLLLDTLGWTDGMVDAVVCGDDVSQGRPAPYLIFRAMEMTGATSVHGVANVGDTILDLQAGYNAGVRWNIGVYSGAHDRSVLERVPHTHLLPSVAELLGVWATSTK